MTEGVHEIFVGYRGVPVRLKSGDWHHPRLIRVCLLVDDFGNVLSRAFTLKTRGGLHGAKEIARRRAYLALSQANGMVDFPVRTSQGQKGMVKSKKAWKTIQACGFSEGYPPFRCKMRASPSDKFLTSREINAVEFWKAKNCLQERVAVVRSVSFSM